MAVAGKALADADDEINGYLSTKFTLPLASTPKVITRVACDIARYYLYADRVTDQVKKRYDDAVKFMKGVAAGDISIGLDQAGSVPATEGGPDFVAGDRAFTRGKADGSQVGTLDDY